MRSIILLLLIPFASLFAQYRMWSLFGLAGRTVNDLRTYGSRVYAATDTGVYVSEFPSGEDSPSWTHVGLAGKEVLAIYPHNLGPLGYAVTAGVNRRYGDPDSCVIYCSIGSDTAWAVADTGINRWELNRIEGIDGFPDPRICGETFAGGSGKIYRRAIGGGWEKVFDFGIGIINVVRTRINPPTVMAGGEGTIFNAFITRSDDLGDSWVTAYPDLAGDNACNSLLFDPADTSSIYAGMEGAIIRTTDGGKSWDDAGLSGTPYYFFGLEYAEMQSSRNLYAVGASGISGPNEFALYVGEIGADSWIPVSPPWPLKGARCIVSAPSSGGPASFLIGTLGDGVMRFTDVPTSTKDPTLPIGLALHQNYPNPFNSSTSITYEIPVRSHVRLEVFSLMGKTVALVVSEEQVPGPHTVRFEASVLPSGIYFCRLTTGGAQISQKMLLLR